MNSNEDKLYIKVVVLNTIYNFVVEFFYSKSFSVKKFNLNFKIYKLKKIETLNDFNLKTFQLQSCRSRCLL